MSQNYNQLVSGSTTFGSLYSILNGNMNALLTLFSGSTAPASPTTYQLWLDTSGATERLKIYDGSSWQDITDYMNDFTSIQTEVENGRGTASNLDGRLSVSINDDGTLKTTTSSSAWITETGTLSYVSSSSFTVEGDVTSVYSFRRAIKLTQTSDAYGYVVSSSYSAGSGLTTVTVTGATVDSGLSAVEYGPQTENTPNDGIDSNGDLTTLGNVYYGANTVSGTGSLISNTVTTSGIAAQSITIDSASVQTMTEKRSNFEYKDSDEIYIHSGRYLNYGSETKMLYIPDTITYNLSGLSGTDIYYIYIDDSIVSASGTIILNYPGYFTHSTTEPTYSQSKYGWYNGNDRCIFAVRVSLGSIYEFHMDGDMVTYDEDISVFTSSSLGTTWTDVTLDIPVFAAKAISTVYSNYIDTSGIYTVWRPNGSSAGGHFINIVTSSTPASMNTLNVITDSSQKIEVKFHASSGSNNITVWANGFYLPSGF